MQAAEADPQAHTGTQGSAQSLTDQETDPLFQPWDLGQFRLKHRIVYAPLTRCRALDPRNVPGENMLEYYSQRARGCEGGLIIAEATSFSATGHGCELQAPFIYEMAVKSCGSYFEWARPAAFPHLLTACWDHGCVM